MDTLSTERHANSAEAFRKMCIIMDELRTRCPWDMKQTWQSLRLLTLEEVYELGDAILHNDVEGVEEECGDVLLHLLFYIRIAEENGVSSLSQMIDRQCAKLIRRHPHIYGDTKVRDEAEVKLNWEKIKQQEKGEKRGVLAGVPQGLPAMIKAYRIQEKTAQVGFEWETSGQVWSKVLEELDELQAEVKRGDQERTEDEFGDVLFALINYARFIKVDPEAALERVNQKFRRRFEHIEAHAPKTLQDMSLEEMDALWNEAKQRGL